MSLQNSLLGSLTPMAAREFNYTGTPAIGTGIKQFLQWAGKQGLIQPSTIRQVVPSLPGMFGGYPQNTKSETSVDALFIALFGVLCLAHLLVWITNLTRKHYFHLQLGFAFFCSMKVIGYATRLAWAHDIPNLNIAVVSVVFIQVPQLALLSLNMVLAHRIFTWRHPETGRHWLLVHFINLIYFIVLIVIAMAVVGQAVPFLHFLDQRHFNMCKNTMKAASILNLYYAFLPVTMLLIAWIMPPGTIVKTPKVLNRKSHEEERVLPPVYQASWVKGAGLFYYPVCGSQIPVYKGNPAAKAVRIIPSREPPGNGNHPQHDDTLIHPNSPKLKWAIVTVTITTMTLVLTTCVRVAACFRTGPWATIDVDGGWKVDYWPHKNYVMYIFYGAAEVAILVFYLLMRVDLRFYIPDLPASRPGDTPEVDINTIPLEDRPVTWNIPTDDVEKGSYSEDSNHKSEYLGSNLTTKKISPFEFHGSNTQNYHGAIGKPVFHGTTGNYSNPIDPATKF